MPSCQAKGIFDLVVIPNKCCIQGLKYLTGSIVHGIMRYQRQFSIL